MDKKNVPDEIFTLQAAADYMHVKRQAVYIALQKGRLKSRREKRNHIFLKKDLDEYRASKYNRDHRMLDGVHIHDLEKGFLSVNHVSKTIAAMLRKPYPTQRVYYLLRNGYLKGHKVGGTWVISIDDAKALYERESIGDAKQLTFA